MVKDTIFRWWNCIWPWWTSILTERGKNKQMEICFQPFRSHYCIIVILHYWNVRVKLLSIYIWAVDLKSGFRTFAQESQCLTHSWREESAMLWWVFCWSWLILWTVLCRCYNATTKKHLTITDGAVGSDPWKCWRSSSQHWGWARKPQTAGKW